MKTTKCVLCGRNFNIDDGTVYDQHVLCPYCGGKFSYLADSPEFSLERLSYALAECRKDEASDRYYTAAPTGARLYIGLIFYGKVFRDRMNHELYLAEMAEIENEMKSADWAYLLENEDDAELAEYFRSKLPEGWKEHGTEKQKTATYVRPKIGILRPCPKSVGEKKNPSVQAVEIRNNFSTERKLKRSPDVSSYCVLAAGICGILIAGFILFHSALNRTGNSRGEKYNVSVSTPDDGQSKRDELLNNVSRRLLELETRRETVVKSIDEIRKNKNQFMTELNRTIERGNVRSAELQTEGRVRLNGAETAMLVLKAPFFNAFAIRYCGDKPFEKAESCRIKIQREIDSSRNLGQSEINALDQLAIAYQENSVGEVRRAINDKFRFMSDLRDKINDAIQTLKSEQSEIRNLGVSQLAEKRREIEKSFQSEAFTTDCGIVAIGDYLEKAVSTEDVFILSNRIQNSIVRMQP